MSNINVTVKETGNVNVDVAVNVDVQMNINVNDFFLKNTWDENVTENVMLNQGRRVGQKQSRCRADRRFQHTCSAVPCTVDMRWEDGDMFIFRSGRIQGSAPAGCEPCDGQWSHGRWVGWKIKGCSRHRGQCTRHCTWHCNRRCTLSWKNSGRQAQQSNNWPHVRVGQLREWFQSKKKRRETWSPQLNNWASVRPKRFPEWSCCPSTCGRYLPCSENSRSTDSLLTNLASRWPCRSTNCCTFKGD